MRVQVDDGRHLRDAMVIHETSRSRAGDPTSAEAVRADRLGGTPGDEALLAHVRPSGWRNPAPRSIYDLVVVGGGTAGLVSAAIAAALGARVALIERDRLGGDCLHHGCVPSKALLRSARAVAEAREAEPFGIAAGEPRADFAAVMRRLRDRRLAIAPRDSAARLAAAGVDVFFAAARFVDRRTLAAGEVRLRFRRAIVATGSRPRLPPIRGLDSVAPLTSDTLFDLDALPSSLAVIGAGPTGCELAQAFALLGSRVTLLEAQPRILPAEDPDAAAVVQRRLERHGLRIETDVEIVEVGAAAHGASIVFRRRGDPGTVTELAAERVLVAAGRAPVFDSLGLEAAGIATSAAGVSVDDRLRTTNPRVYAAGDVCTPCGSTHAADAMARVAVRNALFFGRTRFDAAAVPSCVYTLPELARIGPVAPAAADTITIPFTEIDRAVIDDDEGDGFVRVHHRRGRLVGCTIAGPQAGELIAVAAVALRARAGLRALSETILPYPTRAEAFRRAGDEHRRAQLTPFVRRWLARRFEWLRW
ncbi:MAG TPA: FAD-dependent oxidoreductase [Vicinamibacterales bacterium]|nr:FAD-dependent oxidoreductase [Vicinamibacterales bacterium]